MKQVSKKSRWMIYSSLLLSVLLIVTIVFSVVVGRKGGLDTQREMWFVIGMIALAVVSFVLVLVSRLRRGRYAKMLDERYYAAYEKIVYAFNTSVLGFGERREIKQDILGMLMEGQQAGRPVDNVVGSDISAFVIKVQKSFGYRSGFWFNLLASVQYVTILVVFIQVILYFENIGVKNFFEAEIGLSLFVMFIPLAFIIYPLIKRQMRKEHSISAFIIPFAFGILFIVMLIVLDITAYHVAWVKYFLDTKIRMIYDWWLLIVLAAVVIMAQGAKLYMRHRSIKKLS